MAGSTHAAPSLWKVVHLEIVGLSDQAVERVRVAAVVSRGKSVVGGKAAEVRARHRGVRAARERR